MQTRIMLVSKGEVVPDALQACAHVVRPAECGQREAKRKKVVDASSVGIMGEGCSPEAGHGVVE